MKHTFSFAFKLLQVLLVVNASGFYSIVAPGTVQSHHGYSVSVTLHGDSDPATIKVGITGPSYNETKTIDVTPSNTEVVHFDLPKLKDGQYQLLSEGIEGLIFKNSTNLNYKNKEPKIYIQTDKATYKPGDLVQYRIMALDENTRPVKHLDSLGVVIKDGARHLIKQINDIKLLMGVYSDEFLLSEQPVLGDWFLEVSLGKHDNATKTKKIFTVAKYVLPKFSVDLETDKDISYEEGVVKITVRSKYTYGKSVNGKATITIDVNHGHAKSEKTIEFDGKGYVEFDMINDLQLNTLIENEDFDFRHPLPVNISAVMTEKLTGNKQNKNILVNLHQSSYNIEVPQKDYDIEANKAFEIRAFVKKLDGSPVQDATELATLYISQDPDNEDGSNTEELVFESELDKNGMAVFKVTIRDDGDYPNVIVKYASTTHDLGILTVENADEIENDEEEDVGPLMLVMKTENPKLAHDVTIEVKSNKNMPYYVYAVVARGNIVKQEYVKVPENTKSHEFSFKPTFEMVPHTDLYVYFILDGNLKFQEMSIKFPKEFENKIEITAPKQVKPSEEVTLIIKSDPDSFVGLLGVDQSVLLLKSGNDFDSKTIIDDLSQYDTTTPEIYSGDKYPGKSSGLITLTNANYPYSKERHNENMEGGDDNCDDSDSGSVKVLERRNFLETSIWSQITHFGNHSNGLVTFTKKIPDTITSWVITGFSLNEKTGFGMVENPTNIQVFLPFFVSTNLPYSVKRGEIITIPIYVFNYMDEDLDAEINMSNLDLEYDFTEVFDEGEDLALKDSCRVKHVTVPTNSVEKVTFEIRPNKVGEITMKIQGITPFAGDAINQKLKVEPEGITHFENQAILITPSDTKQSKKETLKASIPAEAVFDSEFVELSVVGDILGPTIKNFHNLVLLPTGCGEQTMVKFVPNILVLDYLDAMKMDMPSTVKKAKKHLLVGYQRLLTYKHKNGAFSAFGEKRKRKTKASCWLTAYIARSLIQARKYITIDAAIIEQALAYVVSNQLESGQFMHTGTLFEPSHTNAVGFTAFALLTFLEDVEYSTKYKTKIDKGIKYLIDQIDNENDSYALSIAALVLQKVQHTQAAKLLQKLEKLAKQANGLKWWTKSSRNKDVEITAYVLQSYIHTEPDEKLLPIIRWLIANRNSKGGYDSTQNTVVALQALIKFDEKYVAGRNGKMTIKYEAQDGEGKKLTEGSFSVDKENLMTLQTHVLPKSSRQITLQVDGLGSSLVQLSYRYNLATNDGNSIFEIKHAIKPSAHPNQLLLNVCTTYVPPADDDVKESNMAVMEIYLPSGYTADTDKLDDICSGKIQKTNTKNSDTAIEIYFESLLAGQQLCFDAVAEKTHAVAKQKPAAIVIYDYYKPKQRATIYYQVESS